jgi:UDP-N-acetylglucosamine-lysosomal-enzyme
MVLVFHLNRRLIHHKCLCLTAVAILLFFIHTFEITYHFLNDCPRDEPIDVVYTWVNGSDPRFVKLLNTYLRKETGVRVDSSAQRYDDKNELKFSLRSLEKFAPWVGHVYIVTNGQIPHWLNLDCDKVSLITHDEIFTDKYNLPTFSSPAIELHLHR